MILLLALAAASTCEDLAKLSLPYTTIDMAETVSSGAFQTFKNLPSFCRVTGSIRPSSDSDIRFEVWMPSTGWNSKFQGIGNGGFAGAIAYGGLANAVTRGYAAAGTDTGHQAGGQDARWALGHPEKIVDFGHRAIHETAVKGKAVVTAFYGAAPKRSYFNSCSNGGRQALMEAQRYPEDYDGIIAGAPANYWSHLMTSAMWSMKSILTEQADYIPASKLKAIQAAMLEACDGADQVTDGVIEQPPLCRADLDALLRCQGTESDSCLTVAQLAALKKIYSGPMDGRGRNVFPGISPGGEAEPGGWGPWITGAEREKSSMFNFGTQFFKNMVYSDANWDYRGFNVDRDLKAAVAKAAPVLNATNPDLKPLLARGGKLILYHGWCDAAIPAQNTIDYYRSVVAKVGAKKASSGVRLFMAPGVQHCAGGAAPNVFGQGGPSGADASKDMNAALERWVEQGVAPEQVVATKYKTGANPASGVEADQALVRVSGGGAVEGLGQH